MNQTTEPQFSAGIDAGTFRPFYRAANCLVDEARWRFDADGLTVRAADPANVGMVDAHLSADAFDTFDADGGELGMNYSRLGDLVDPGDRAGYDTDPDTPLTFERVDHRKMLAHAGAFEYDIGLIDPASIRKEPNLPDALDLPARVSFRAGAFAEAIHRANAVSNHAVLAFDSDGETLTVEAEGEVDTVAWDTADAVTVEQSGRASSWFSLDYLTDIAAAPPEDARVTLDLGEEYPLRLQYEIVDGAGHVTFMLAPRIGGD